ncbi:MAG: MraY family glycosyltransferase [Verrucomicrobiales bacterium]|nr:MraY family glycosyltransferase [Verrucomicrobiales bacterium]
MNLLVFVAFAAVGLGTCLALIPLLRRQTGPRAIWTFHHTHRVAVSRFGGVALAAAFVTMSLAIFFGHSVAEDPLRTRLVIFFSALAMFGLGLWDDIRPLGARRKLLVQVLIALAVCYSGVRIEKFQNPLTGEILELGAWGWVVTVLWLVALTNLINIIDGIDGLAAGIGLMLMGLIAYVGLGGELLYPVLIAAGMVGALAGFLYYNFPPAKIYLGDGGAYLIGYLIAILTLVHSQKGTIVAALIAPLFALALPIVDVSLAIVRRGLRGLPIFRPDRKHLHHKLLEVGFSRTRAVLILYGLSLVFLLMAFGVFWSQGRWVPILFGFLCVVLLLSARTFNFSRDWFAVGRVLENSAELRRETHYALALTRWLELEADRGAGLEELWSDFTFIARKLGFSRVQWQFNGQSRCWEDSERPAAGEAFECVHELGAHDAMVLSFEGDGRRMSRRVFEHLAELAAEGWLKAVNRSMAVNGAAALPTSPGPAPTGAGTEKAARS